MATCAALSYFVVNFVDLALLPDLANSGQVFDKVDGNRADFWTASEQSNPPPYPLDLGPKIAIFKDMALVRILVDGYSLLHAWEALAPGKARYSSAAREELINRLTHYHDASGTPITVVFDGASSEIAETAFPSTPEVEIIYSRAGQTADQLIERVAHRLSSYGEVLVVTDDLAERDTVTAGGAMFSSCLGFIQTIESALAELEREVKNLNRSERSKFQRSR